MPNQWVVPHNGAWAVRGEGSKKVTKQFSHQATAIAEGKQIAKNQGVELIVQGKNGQIRERNTYGKDPFPPKG
ncbi:DUF2188 domain-containing protein [Chitinibacter tainanensis]|uniref:DUF2188 domain-containing protein n=1 Tax=Chitinibacter tainanensis TaxID=230667 RepID=UPI00235411B3|nr:DUF2188 domain-containing protein [Chitinibacter tainanensis]